jgi:AMP deaminase
MSYEQGRTGIGSEDSWDEREDKEDELLPEAAIMAEETPATSTPSETQEGMLPRDIQRKTAYYDYAAEKQLSQADAKLFYQISQLEAQKTGGSSKGATLSSPRESPVIVPRSTSSLFEAEQAGLRRSGSINSMKSGQHVPQRLDYSTYRMLQLLIIIVLADTNHRSPPDWLICQSIQKVIPYKNLR